MPDAALPPTVDDHAERRRWRALIALCTGMLMIVLDGTVTNVALPSIQRDLGFSSAGLAWVVNAYMIAFGGLLLLAGRLGDLVSRRGVYLAGLGVFTVASLLCGLSQTQAMLVIARFLQGVGGAMTSAVILGMIVTMFPSPGERARALGVYAFVASAGGSIGLLVGGAITQTIDWHWIFFVNIPIGVATALASLRLLDRDRGIGVGGGADVPGAVLITAGVMAGVYAIVGPAAQHGWGSAGALGFLALAVALIAAFLWRESHAAQPLVPLRIFRLRNVSGSNIVQVLVVAGMFGMFFMGALYLQRVLGYDPFETGLAFLPMTLLMGTLSVRYSERLVMRFGARRMLLIGNTLFAVGLALLVRAPVDGEYVRDVLPTMLVMGTGAGIGFAGVMTLAMSGVAPQDAGLASGLINTSTQVGGALGLAVLATLSATRTKHLRAAGDSLASALVGGYRLAFLLGAVLIALAVAVAALVMREEPLAHHAEAPASDRSHEPATDSI
ncbi:MAG TPA: MFS transporter [Solirubrobacteraceae bacterium]|nr:MFS transporter [Solirubrobacteraceae bacterium]